MRAFGGSDLFEKRSENPKTLEARQILAAREKAWTGCNTEHDGSAGMVSKVFKDSNTGTVS